MLLLLSGANVAPIGARPAAAQSPAAAQIDRWINELGDDNYTVRKAAADRLAAGGFAAREALAKLVDGPDPETRWAARRLVTLIDDTEFNRRLAEFADDVDGSRGVTLPGWREFGELVGRDTAARTLFVDMQREEAPLLERKFDAPAGENDVAWEDQVARLIRARMFSRPGEFTAPLGSCATMLFLGALPDAELTDSGASTLVQLTQLPPIVEALAANRPENAVRRLVSAWVVRCPNRSEQVLEQRLAMMFQYQLADALPLALEMVERGPRFLTLRPPLQVNAILAIGKFGSAADVVTLEPLLDDHTQVVPQPSANGLQGNTYVVQVRDVALATMLHLTGQEPLTYGFLQVRPHPQTTFELTSLGMENDERRAAAAEQWRAWRAQHKLESPRAASS